MGAAQFLKTRVSTETKQRVHAIAEQQLITESVWLKRLVLAELSDSQLPAAVGKERVATRPIGDVRRSAVLHEDFQGARGARIYIRLRPEDRLLLRERAAARGMRAATYVSVLMRAHLRSLPPLPKDELVALKRSVAELGALGRNVNQLTRAANQGGRIVGPSREDLRAILKVCEALRDNVKGLIRANVNSWELGNAEAEG